MNDAALLARIPDVVLGPLLKATPAMEGDRRILYFEASNEGRDQQAEIVASRALAESAEYYLRYGNVDIDHFTQVGAKQGIPNYASYEIGHPLEVKQRGSSTFVKAEVFSGEGPIAEKANMLWTSVADLKPPQRWYPSVGGAVLGKSIYTDPRTGEKTGVIDRVRWTNIGLSKTPVNQHVGTAATVPLDVFAKSLTAGGTLDLMKTLEAGYATDSGAMTGAAAFRRESFDHAVQKPSGYFDFRNKLSTALRKGGVSAKPDAASIVAYARAHFGYSDDEAAEHVERFMQDLRSGVAKKRMH
jgi:hypothetical protein